MNATGDNAGNVPFVLWLSVNGNTRKIELTSYVNGFFIYRFFPSLNEAGTFTFAAVHPAAVSTTPQGAFDIIGMKTSTGRYLQVKLPLGPSKSIWLRFVTELK